MYIKCLIYGDINTEEALKVTKYLKLVKSANNLLTSVRVCMNRYIYSIIHIYYIIYIFLYKQKD